MRWSVSPQSLVLVILIAILFLPGCGSSVNRYLLIEQSLQAGDFTQAAAIVERAEKDYGGKSRLLYDMDRGMTLQLAGQYQLSSLALERAEEEVERLYTRTIRSETAAFLSNDNALPYEGDPYEHVMINVVKALNYAAQGELREALVEARRIDHRLNVLSDRVKDAGSYRNDGFARYLSGILYEATGDLNNAFIAYRNAYEAYEAAQVWSRTPGPSSLRSDLLRTAEALHLTAELEEYRRRFPELSSETFSRQEPLAQVVMISYNGRAPRKEDRYLDLPISLDALQLVLLNRGFSPSAQRNRAADSILYGLNGRVVRVALPRLVPQKTQVRFETMTLTDSTGRAITVRSELAHDVTALAEKSLSDRLPGITVKALARAVTKFALAEGATRGAQQAAGKDAGPWVGLLVGLLSKGLAVASEEADKRSWQTLPDEIHVARAWVPPGSYQVSIHPSGQRQGGGHDRQMLDLAPGQTLFLIQRVMQ
ncbi:COG3014 family protein [Nitrospira moscoviensis]|uniref:Uncharacterized protein n=1 Tax=Nitrospira moscoviensis TaxID=42253 RepID=A0A0K2GF38_NITMO|nr:hypothetical protein [Nitrospira moscoviensis]ALA59575.1 hypothetical protein NITMOv2_3176 [Nitrospira moscoviensis]